MFAKKANKVYRVDEATKDSYLKQGYDITDDKGKVIEHSHLSVVKYADYAKLEAENIALKEELAAFKAVEEKETKKK